MTLSKERQNQKSDVSNRRHKSKERRMKRATYQTSDIDLSQNSDLSKERHKLKERTIKRAIYK